MLKIRFLGADREVTGSCYLLDYNGCKVIIDCGMYQGDVDLEKRNAEEFHFDPKEIKYILLTHAHLDHCGLIPKLVKHGFKGKILMTPPTRDIFEVTAFDTAKIQKEDALRDVTKPIIYSSNDVIQALKQSVTVSYDEPIQLTENFSVSFKHSGHILGSAFLYMQIEGKKVLFSGDLGHKGQSLIKPLDSIDEVDYMIIESTYANRDHKPKEESQQELIDIINETVKNSGNIIVPTFAIERTQELIFDIKKFVKQQRLPQLPVYVDSPMAGRVTDIFSKYFAEFNADTQDIIMQGDNPFYFEGLRFVQDSKRSRKISTRNIGKNNKGESSLVLAGSGMCTGGRVLSYLMRNLPLERSAIVFAGYQAEGTLGREIVDGNKEVEIYGKKYQVRANIITLGGFSAHADKHDLLDWVGKMTKKPTKTFICHGDEQISLGFAQTLKEEFNMDAQVPFYDTEVSLEL